MGEQLLMGHDFKDCLASDILDIHRKCLLSLLLIVIHKPLWLPFLFLAVYTSLVSCVVLYIDVRRFKVSQLFPLWFVKGLSAALYCHQTQGTAGLWIWARNTGGRVHQLYLHTPPSTFPSSSFLLLSQILILFSVVPIFLHVFTAEVIVLPKMKNK